MEAKVSYLRLLTDNFPEMFDFYSKTLNFPVIRGNRESNYAEFETKNIYIAIFKKHLMAEALGVEYGDSIQECQDKGIIVLEVKDVEKTASKLRSKNVVLLQGLTERKEWNVKTIHLRDPDGNVIEINTPFNL